MMQRWNQLDALLSRCRKDPAFRQSFCSTPLLGLLQFVYNHSTIFALLTGFATAMLFDGWAWIFSILIALIVFIFLPLGLTWLIKVETL